MKILITGTAGFIGSHLVWKLGNSCHEIIGLDSINDYYDPGLKYGRLDQSGIDKKDIEYGKLLQSSQFNNYKFIQLDLTDKKNLDSLFQTGDFDAVCHLAAQAGVRYSLMNPMQYIESNVVGFIHILEACRNYRVQNLSYASSSSVYGLNTKIPFSVNDNTDHPASLYAASKKSNEMFAHSYSHIFGIPTTAMRFFTVYGPWGRPDMAPFIFTKSIIENQEIQVFNHGKMKRDFTYIDDIVEGIIRVIHNPARINPQWDSSHPDCATSSCPWQIYNMGKGSPMVLLDFIYEIEQKLNKKAKMKMMDIQPGDVVATWADTSDLQGDLQYRAKVSLKEGIGKFIDWYQDFYS